MGASPLLLLVTLGAAVSAQLVVPLVRNPSVPLPFDRNQAPLMDNLGPGPAIPPPSDPSPAEPPAGTGGGVVLSDVMGRDRSINLFAGYVRGHRLCNLRRPLEREYLTQIPPDLSETPNPHLLVLRTRRKTRPSLRRSTRPSKNCRGNRGRTPKITAPSVPMHMRAARAMKEPSATCGGLLKPTWCLSARGRKARRSRPSGVTGRSGGKRRMERD